MTIAIETIPHKARKWPSGIVTCDDKVQSIADRCNRQEVTLVGAAEAICRDVTVYGFLSSELEFGLDPWRVVDGIDEYFDGKTVDIWFASGAHRTMFKDNMSMRFFVSKKDA